MDTVNIIITVGALLCMVYLFARDAIRSLFRSLPSIEITTSNTPPGTAQEKRNDTQEEVAMTPQGEAKETQETSGVATLQSHTAFDWWQTVINDVVHLMVVGETGSGKSTAVRAILGERAIADRLLIIDPHSKFNDWSGLPVIGSGRNWSEIDQTFIALDAELTRRYTPGEDTDDALTIVVDEYPVIAAECEHARKTFLRLAREGRKPSMRLIVLTQEPSVRALGIEGEGEARKNFSKLLLGSFAVQATSEAHGKHPGALVYKGNTHAVNTAMLPGLALQHISSSCIWDLCIDTMSTSAAWTDAHILVAAWIIDDPEISIREIARRLYPGTNGGGDYSTRAKAIVQQVRSVLDREGVRC